MSEPLGLPCYSTITRGATVDQVVATITTGSTDRVGDQIVARGGDFAAFWKNPVVLWAHDHSIPPIGRCVDLRVVGDTVRATTEFAPTVRGREVRDLYLGEFLHSWSVGIRPLASEPIKGGGTRFTRWELLEYSAVPVPANAEAVTHRSAEPLDVVRKRYAALARGGDLAALRADLADSRRRWERDVKGLDALTDDLRRQENWLRAIKLEIQQAIRYS